MLEIQHNTKDSNMSQMRLILTGLLAAGLVGCGTNMPDPDPIDSSSSSTASESSGGSEVYSPTSGGGGEDIPYETEMKMVIYFDFDQSDLKAEYADTLARHARKLSNSSRTRVRLEGHADERGSREYNIGLGERRSQAVRRMLLIQGSSTNQISTVSFGEERPASMGSDEDSYSLNRRVEIKYLN